MFLQSVENARVNPCDISISSKYSCGILPNLVTSSELMNNFKIHTCNVLFITFLGTS